MSVTKIDHIGVAVKNIDEAKKIYELPGVTSGRVRGKYLTKVKLLSLQER